MAGASGEISTSAVRNGETPAKRKSFKKKRQASRDRQRLRFCERSIAPEFDALFRTVQFKVVMHENEIDQAVKS